MSNAIKTQMGKAMRKYKVGEYVLLCGLPDKFGFSVLNGIVGKITASFHNICTVDVRAIDGRVDNIPTMYNVAYFSTEPICQAVLKRKWLKQNAKV